MLSKIDGFVTPSQSKGDTVEKPGEQSREKGGGQKKDQSAPEESGDAMFFSVEAVRALLAQENALSDDITACLDLLLQHGIASIPLRDNQDIVEAVRDAAALLKK